MDATFAPEWTADELYEHLLARDRFLLLDVRPRDEFEAWRIEGREPIPTRNAPYPELIERAGSREPSAVAGTLVAMPDPVMLTKDATTLVACAKGNNSQVMADGLRQLGFRVINLTGGMEAWSHVTFTKPFATEAGFTIFQIGRPARGCLSYVIASSGEAAIIDPLRDPEPYLELMSKEQLRIRFVLDTHAHADHLSGGPVLALRLGVPYSLHPYDAIHPIDLLPAKVRYQPLHDGQTLDVGAAKLEVLHIPGHTLGNLALKLGSFVLAGDSIFIDSVARPDLGGRGEAWASLHWHSLRRLLALGDDVTVLPGHFSRLAESDPSGRFAARLGDLRMTNAGLLEAQKSEREFVAWIVSHLPAVPPRYMDIKRVNLGLKQVDEDAAGELEVGKNVCAMAASH